jgi:hypothetical protein
VWLGGNADYPYLAYPAACAIATPQEVPGKKDSPEIPLTPHAEWSGELRNWVLAKVMCNRIDCNFVVFETVHEAHSILGNLPPGTQRLEL